MRNWLVFQAQKCLKRKLGDIITCMHQSLHIKTPLIESLSLGGYLKMDALQPTGSFKIRGIGRLCLDYLAKGQTECFVSSSGGNAGIAVSYAGRKLGVPVRVVVPETASPLMLERIKQEGAEVSMHGLDWNGADEKVQQMLLENPRYAYIPPFDHPLIWAGHSTLIHEIAEDSLKPDVVIVAVGGGGLLCGVIQGLHELGWGDVPVISAETQGAASMAVALRAGEPVTLEAIKTIAISLGARRVANQAFAWSKEHEIISFTVSDQQASKACVRFADEHRVLVEPSCGTALAVVYEGLLDRSRFKKPLIVVCGGNAVSLKLLNDWNHSSHSS